MTELTDIIREENAPATLHALLKGIGAKMTRETISESLLLHPNFPDLLSMSEVLSDFAIDNAALQLNTAEQLRELPLPFIAHTKKHGGWYVLVTAIKGKRITYTDSVSGRSTEGLDTFAKQWSGVILMAETNEHSGEVAYSTKHQKEVLANLRVPFLLGGVCFLFLLAVFNTTRLQAYEWSWLLTKMAGLSFSVLLVAKQLGSQNALADRLCRIGSKISCEDVLNSPVAKLWGWLSWADVGLLYFAGGVLATLLAGWQTSFHPLLEWLALLALPYIMFSIYYQGVVLRQWCTLCLGVQAVLLLEGGMAVMKLSPAPSAILPYIFLFSTFLVPVLLWVWIKPLLVAIPESRREHNKLMRLRRDPHLFQALLTKQPRMHSIPADLHPIVLGNPDGKHSITVVTNPFCGPCASAHHELEQVLQLNSDVRANIIFTGNKVSGRQVAAHALTLASQGNVADALTDWYGRAEKQVDSWIDAYPTGSHVTEIGDKVEQHIAWCKLANIQFTPTVFVNGYLLPKQYWIGNLKWFMSASSSIYTDA